MSANTMPPPFPIILDVTGDAKVFRDVGLPDIKVHFYVGEPRTAENPEVDTHILCWSLTDAMPEYSDSQEYWYTSYDHSEVTCPACLQWLHA